MPIFAVVLIPPAGGVGSGVLVTEEDVDEELLLVLLELELIELLLVLLELELLLLLLLLELLLLELLELELLELLLSELEDLLELLPGNSASGTSGASMLTVSGKGSRLDAPLLAAPCTAFRIALSTAAF